MSKYLICCSELTRSNDAFISEVEIPDNLSSDGWGRLYDRMVASVKSSRKTRDNYYVWATRVRSSNQRYGVVWSEDYAPQGVNLTLLPRRYADNNLIVDTVAEQLRHERDVLSLRKIRPVRYVEIDVEGLEVDPPALNLWDNNEIQFARLISELQAAGAFTNGIVSALEDSMDLDRSTLFSLVERADAVFEESKKQII